LEKLGLKGSICIWLTVAELTRGQSTFAGWTNF
jgi:hypothetical protein